MTTKYYNYRRNEAECNEEIIFCADDAEKSSHYGNIKRTFIATDRTDKDHKKVTKHAMDFFGVDEETAENCINPDRIVTSAGAWDNIEFINYLYDETCYFSKYDGIITNDGAVFFEINDKNLISVEVL